MLTMGLTPNSEIVEASFKIFTTQTSIPVPKNKLAEVTKSLEKALDHFGIVQGNIKKLKNSLEGLESAFNAFKEEYADCVKKLTMISAPGQSTIKSDLLSKLSETYNKLDVAYNRQVQSLKAQTAKN